MIICSVCGLGSPKLKSSICAPCKNKPKRGYCKECGKPSYSVKKKLCVTCFNRYIVMIPLKLRCHNILGWICVCCKRNDVNHLEFDHIKPITRKQIPLRKTYNDIIWMGIKAHEKYQILCHLCNNSKGDHEKCSIEHKYDLSNIQDCLYHMKELGVEGLDDIKIPEFL